MHYANALYGPISHFTADHLIWLHSAQQKLAGNRSFIKAVLRLGRGEKSAFPIALHKPNESVLAGGFSLPGAEPVTEFSNGFGTYPKGVDLH